MVKVVGKYEIGKTLGEGTFGKVKMATHMVSGHAFAIKILDKKKIQKQKMGDQIKKEISIMKKIKFKYIVELKEVLASQTKIFIVLELITGGELFDKIVAAGKFQEDEARKYTNQLIDGIDYCHNLNICHRDLKPENLLLDQNGDLKISDFGLSSLQRETTGGGENILHTPCGTPNYVAPEVLKDQGYDGKSADIWSCGVILYVMLAGFLPFDDPNTATLFRKIQSAEFSVPSWVSPGAANLIRKILVPDPSRRYTIADIREDPWFKVNYTPAAKENPIEVSSGDIEEAFTATMGLEDDGSSSSKTGATSADGKPTPKGPDGKPTPITMNAFDLISLSGALDLTRMLQSKMTVQRATRFVVEKDPSEILNVLEETLKDIGLHAQVVPHAFKIKVATEKVAFQMQILQLAPNLHIVDFRRGKGDILSYQSTYRQIYEKVAPVLNANPAVNPMQGANSGNNK